MKKVKCAMNKVCKPSISDLKILRFLYDCPEGLRVKTIKKLGDFKTRVVYKRLNLLKEQGLVESISPIWCIPNGQVEKCAKLLNNDKLFELAGLSYVVKFIKTPDWWKARRSYLMKLKEYQFKQVNFGKMGKNPYHQLMNDQWVIQCYPESIIIVSKKRYYSNQPFDTIRDGMSDVIALLDFFCERFRFDFWQGGTPAIEIRNNDYNRIASHLSQYCKKEGTKFLVELDQRRKVWIDKSEPLGTETNYPEGQETLEKVTKDILLNKPMLPSEMQGLMGNLIKEMTTLVSFNKNLQSELNQLKGLPRLEKKEDDFFKSYIG